jgi:hypothetical protein
MRSSRTLFPCGLLLLLAGSPTSATAHDWLHEWRAMRAEYQPEFEYARWIERLDCASLSAYVDQQYWLTNQRVYAEYQRSMPRSAPAPGAASAPLNTTPLPTPPPPPTP